MASKVLPVLADMLAISAEACAVDLTLCCQLEETTIDDNHLVRFPEVVTSFGSDLPAKVCAAPFGFAGTLQTCLFVGVLQY